MLHLRSMRADGGLSITQEPQKQAASQLRFFCFSVPCAAGCWGLPGLLRWLLDLILPMARRSASLSSAWEVSEGVMDTPPYFCSMTSSARRRDR